MYFYSESVSHEIIRTLYYKEILLIYESDFNKSLYTRRG